MHPSSSAATVHPALAGPPAVGAAVGAPDLSDGVVVVAGQPRKKAMVGELERRARRNEQTTLEYVADWVESGKTITQLKDSINESLEVEEEQGCTRAMLSRYVNRELEGLDTLAEARAEGSHGMAESAITIIDEPAEDKVQAAQRKTQAEMRLKLAGFWNRKEYGEQRGPDVNVNLNLGELHLDALRHREVPRVVARTQPTLPPAESDVEQA